MSDNSFDNDAKDQVTLKPKKRRFFLKFFLIILALCIVAVSSLSYLLSEERVAGIIEDAFYEHTGLTLNISDLDFVIFNGHIVIKDVTSVTSTGKVVGSLEDASLKLGLIDAYNLYRFNTIHIENLEIHNLNLNKVPYLDIIHDISPDSSETEYNKAISKFVEHTTIKASKVYLEQTSGDTIKYSINGNFDGTFSGGGKIEGEINGISKNNFNALKLTGKTKNFNFNLNEQDIDNTYSGKFSLENMTCNFTGTLISQVSPLKILRATPETTYRGSGSWDIKNKTITIPDVLITNADGLTIQANGLIKNPTKKEKRIISAEISDSLAQLPDLKLPHDPLVISLNEGFSFIGKIYISPDKLDIKGRTRANNVTYTKDRDHFVQSTISTYFTATKESLLFEDIDIGFDNTNITGSLFIPTNLFKANHKSIYDLNGLELNLNLNGEMSDISKKLYTIGHYPNEVYVPEGDISCKITVNLESKQKSNIIFSIGSNDKNVTLYKSPFEKIKVGRFTGNLQASINSKGTIIVDQLAIKSKPLILSFEANNSTAIDTIEAKYNIDIDLASFYPILPQRLSRSTQAISNIILSGSGNYSTTDSTFTSKNSKTEIHLNNSTSPSFVKIEGPITLNTNNDWLLRLPESSVSIYNTDIINNTQSIGCTATLKSEATLLETTSNNEHLFSPKGSATLGIRSKNSTLINFFYRLGMSDITPIDTSSIILRAKLDFTKDTINCLSQASINNFVITTPVDFSDDTLSAIASLEYDIPDNKLKINELKINDSHKGYEFTAAGNIYIENNIFESFNSKLTADLELYLPHFKGYGVEKKYRGKIEVFSELVGTASSPSLTLVGKSDMVSITHMGYTDTADNPRFDAQLSWSRDADGNIYGLRAEEIFLKSSNGAIYLTGNAERVKFEKGGIVDFGKGCDIDLAVKANRKLLWLFIPYLSSSNSSKGNADSIIMSAHLKAPKMPIFSFDKAKNLRYFDDINITNGKIKVDKIEQNGLNITDISADFSLNNSIAETSNGKAQMYGNITFSTITDLSTKVPSGTVNLNLLKVDLASLASSLSNKSSILNGWLNIPSNSPISSLNLTWKGRTKDELISSITTKRESASIKDLVFESINKPYDWEKYLSADLPPAFAREIAKHINEKLAPTYGKKKKSYYKYFDADYKLSKGALRINSIKCGGGNTADLLIRGVVSYDGRLKLRVYPVSNLQKTIDIRKMLDIPSVKSLTATLSPQQRDNFYNIIPSTVDKLVREKKIFIDVTGTIDNPEINIDYLRKEIRRNIPLIVTQFNNTVGQEGILQLLLKDIKSDKIRNALGANGSDSSLKSGSSIGDLLKLIE